MELVAAPVLAAAAVILAMAALRTRLDRTVLTRLAAPSPARHRGRAWRVLERLGASGPAQHLPGRTRIDRRLRLAAWWVTVNEFMGCKIVAALPPMLVGLFAPFPGPLVAPFVGLAGFRIPDVLVARAARRRMELADRETPLLLDMLAAASSAGLSGQLALRRSVDAIEGPLAQELSAALRSVDLGARWRDELRATADALGLSDLRRAVAAMTRAESLGSSLTDALWELAAEVREARRGAATEHARKAPVKMLFPLVFTRRAGSGPRRARAPAATRCRTRAASSRPPW
jgi:Flp pilus assembly protein TadB